ncbi:MAG: hypothetical protein ABIF77_14820 [bacterium]
MKLVIIFSAVTFVLIFGTVFVVINSVQSVSRPARVVPELSDFDQDSGDRVFRDIAAERDRIQCEKEGVLVLRQQLDVQEAVMDQATLTLRGIIQEMESQQAIFSAEKEKSARKLAKMYESMKPAAAAPILAALDMEIILEIMSRMNERPAAKILSAMDAGLAARISMQMSIKGDG